MSASHEAEGEHACGQPSSAERALCLAGAAPHARVRTAAATLAPQDHTVHCTVCPAHVQRRAATRRDAMSEVRALTWAQQQARLSS
eukprot:6209701-Pleurochrysis_carterae.AAC.1